MSEQQDKNNSLKDKFTKKPNMPKNPFNFYWIYGIIAVALIAMQMMNFNSPLIEVQQDEFYNNMLKQHHVSKIVVIPNEQVAEIYINREDLNQDEFKKEGLDKHPNGPHYKMKILDVASFKTDLDKVQGDTTYFPANVKKLYPITEVRTSWSDQLSWILPIVLMVVIWIIIMRRMGGGAGGGQIFNIGKSKATLFDKDSNVNITFNDVAGLEGAKVEIKEIVDFLKSSFGSKNT
jgi:AFG3 family protein